MEYQYREDSIKNAAKRLLLLKELKSYGAGTSDTKNFYIAVIRFLYSSN